MEKLVNRFLRRYGASAVLLTAGEAEKVKVFFTSVKSSAWENMERLFSPLGEVPRGRYLCLFPATVEPQPEDTLTLRGKSYVLRRIEDMAAFDRVACRCALCVEKGSVTDGA